MKGFRFSLVVAAQILALTGVCLAYGEDDPYTYSKISAVKESQIQVISGDLYSSGKVIRPTSVYFPTLLIKNVGFSKPEGWHYETETDNTDIYTRDSDHKVGERSLVTKVVIWSTKEAKDSDMVLMDQNGRVLLLHLHSSPKMLKNVAYYSEGFSLWPTANSFVSEGLQELNTQK